MNIAEKLASELSIKVEQAVNTIRLIDEDNTIPFIARYRKEVTGGLDDGVLRTFNDRLTYLRNLEERKEEVIRLIDGQGKLTEELEAKIREAEILREVEDLYRPYKQKRRTRATIAKEKGLEPLAEIMLDPATTGNVSEILSSYINPEKEVLTEEDAAAGAMDIIAENISDNADYRKKIYDVSLRTGIINTSGDGDEGKVYEMYYEFSESISKIANHRILAIDRGEREGFLKVRIDVDEERITDYLHKQVSTGNIFENYVKDAATDAYGRLIAPSIEREIRSSLTERAGEAAIVLFSKNLHNLLLQPPVKGKTVLGVDPGYRTGCKVAVVDETGKVCDTGIIYCTLEHHDKEKSKKYVLGLIDKYGVDLIAIGNGTASRESEIFVADVIKGAGRTVKYAIVNEAGASVYSASDLGAEEFPDFTVEQRSAASIARRIQDPLSELVKIDPKSIGVGQYQHDMNQKRLGESLGGVVEDCVNAVGVDLNTAGAALLSYISGISGAVAKNIVKYREENGKFKKRSQLLKVGKLGPKAYVQCAGFLRIPGGDEMLDNTSVHPESYEVAEKLISALGYNGKGDNFADIKERMKDFDTKKFCTDNDVGLPTVEDIADSLARPGRDIREDMESPVLSTDVMSMEDLKEGMIMTGTVRNVIDFGAFVDIGVHQDGLVHISQICDKYIKHPMEILNVGDVVKVKVIGVDLNKKRISLSMRDL
ncbi:MAG: RNA-binding transcriptional accessory protein [Clostridia bacterium]|nr:RNA-binding transcriptional accessory protein [Clostridia bacterium]